MGFGFNMFPVSQNGHRPVFALGSGQGCARVFEGSVSMGMCQKENPAQKKNNLQPMPFAPKKPLRLGFWFSGFPKK